MPTVIGHAATGIGLGPAVSNRTHRLQTVVLCVCCSTVPDLDSVGFLIGIPYEHWLGHRGFSHSLLFSAILALVAGFLTEKSTGRRMPHTLLFFVCAALHGTLDAMTNGGLGVACFSPFDRSRYFLPWQPIEVSPLNMKRFFSVRGIEIIANEFVWVILLSLCMAALVVLHKQLNRIVSSKHEKN